MTEIQPTGEGNGQNENLVRRDDPGKVLAVRIYRDLLGMMTKKRSRMRLGYEVEAEKIWEEMKPRDAMERMMVSHLMWTHARIAFLSGFAMRQKNWQWSELMNRQCDSAVVSYSKQLASLMDYRNPGRGRSFTAIKQANIARSQRIIGGDVVGEN